MALGTLFFKIFNQSNCLHVQYPQKSIIDHVDIRVDIHARKGETNCNSVNLWSQVFPDKPKFVQNSQTNH